MVIEKVAALAEATARTSEISHIVVSDLDFANRRVWIHGSSKAEARWGLLIDWGGTQLVRRIGSLKNVPTDDSALAYEGRGSEESAQASSCIAIAETLTRAGIGREPDVRPGSVVAWAGRRISCWSTATRSAIPPPVGESGRSFSTASAWPSRSERAVDGRSRPPIETPPKRGRRDHWATTSCSSSGWSRTAISKGRR